jgi:hypothetical protein
MTLQEIQHALEPFRVGRVLHTPVFHIKTMFTVCDRDEVVFDIMLFKYLGHQDRLLVGNIRVFNAMQQHGWRIVFGHIADRAKRVETSWFRIRVVPTYFFSPETLLLAVKEKLESVIGT